MGIQPVEIRVIEADAQETRRGYLGIVIRYREESEVIPVVQGTTGLEYDLTSMIRRLVRTRTPTLGVTQMRGELRLAEDLGRLEQLLSQNYALRPIEGERLTEIDSEVDALLVVGNREAYAPEEQQVIDQFLMQGKGAAFLLDLAAIDLQTFAPTRLDHGFTAMLSTYGIDVGDRLVADVESASLNVRQQRGFMVIQVPVRYPFMPQMRFLEGDSALTRGLSDAMLPFTTALHVRQVDGVEIDVLASSSRESWLEAPEPQALHPSRDWGAARIEATGPYDLIAHASGTLPSHFASGSGGAVSREDGLVSHSLDEARVVVAGGASIARDAFLTPGNAALLQNLVDCCCSTRGCSRCARAASPAFPSIRISRTRGATR